MFDRKKHCQKIASKGGRATVARHGRDHMAAIGRRGFIATTTEELITVDLSNRPGKPDRFDVPIYQRQALISFGVYDHVPLDDDREEDQEVLNMVENSLCPACQGFCGFHDCGFFFRRRSGDHDSRFTLFYCPGEDQYFFLRD